MRINWTKVAEAFAVHNPYGPVIGLNGEIFAYDGTVIEATEPTSAPESVAAHPTPAARAPELAVAARPVLS
jgi:hypothetical protein